MTNKTIKVLDWTKGDKEILLDVFNDGCIEIDYYDHNLRGERPISVYEMIPSDKAFELYKALKEVFEDGTI